MPTATIAFYIYFKDCSRRAKGYVKFAGATEIEFSFFVGLLHAMQC